MNKVGSQYEGSKDLGFLADAPLRGPLRFSALLEPRLTGIGGAMPLPACQCYLAFQYSRLPASWDPISLTRLPGFKQSCG